MWTLTCIMEMVQAKSEFNKAHLNLYCVPCLLVICHLATAHVSLAVSQVLKMPLVSHPKS